MAYTFYENLWFFFLYSFLGWCAEVAFAAVRHGKFVNRGFLNGPVCPIYGYGLVGVLALLEPISQHLVPLFFGAMLVTTTLEFCIGWLMERLFHAKWWDYSTRRFNLKGYVCLEFAILWGLGATFMVRIIHPAVAALVRGIPHTVGVVFLWIFAAAMLVDLIATLATIRHLQKRLRLITAVAGEMHELSDKLGENLSGAVMNVQSRAEDYAGQYKELADLQKANRAEEKALFDAHQAREKAVWNEIRARQKERHKDESSRLDDLRAKLSAMVREKRPGQKRLLAAFPALRQSRYAEAVRKFLHSEDE